MENLTEISKDSLFNGALLCYQHKDGYRFSIDSVLLADFAKNWKGATILDLGCGSGILGLILLYRNFGEIKKIYGIEYQKSLADLARRNTRENNFEDKQQIIHGNYVELKKHFSAESFTHVICNPPFYRVGRGRPSKQEEAYLARHQVVSSTADLTENISYGLKNKGTVAIIYPAELLAELISLLRKSNLEPKYIRTVYSYPDAEFASLVLLECRKNGGVGLKYMKPLYIYEHKDGEYTKEVKYMYQPDLITKESHERQST